MANKAKIQHNLKRKRLVKKEAKKREELKAIIHDRSLSMEKRFAAQQELSSLHPNSAKNRIRNRCAIDGRPRGYYRKFDMSRIELRILAGEGIIPGLVKASW